MVGVTALVVVASGVHAQDLEPRVYANTPVGLNFLIAGYGYTEGGVTADPSVPLEDAEVQTHTAVLAYVRSPDVWGKSGKLDVILPYAWTSGSATFEGQPHQRDVSGFGDPRFRFSVNLYGAPALSLTELEDYKQDTIVGVSLQVSAPGGRTTIDGVRGAMIFRRTYAWASPSHSPWIGTTRSNSPAAPAYSPGPGATSTWSGSLGNTAGAEGSRGKSRDRGR